MRHIFKLGEAIDVPDGTVVHSSVAPSQFGLDGLSMMDQVSVAQGNLSPGICSNIHVHPIVQQVTWVLSGTLTVKMKDAENEHPYELEVVQQQAVVTHAGTQFQLMTQSERHCQARYIVAPAFVFESDASGDVIYNDALVLIEDWDQLAAVGWKISTLQNLNTIRKKRQASLERLAQRRPE